MTPEIAPRTIRVNVQTYNWILEYFSRSPDGIKGQAAIRKYLHELGHECHRRMQRGRTACISDMSDMSFLAKQHLTKPTNKDASHDL